MAHWLLKSEPGDWSWADQVDHRSTQWDGVKNKQALGHMREMAVGDTAFFYHSGDDRRIMGIVEITEEFHDDPNDPDSGLVKVRALEHLPQTVSLADIKAEDSLADLPLVKQPRLSVMPIPEDAWNRICEMGKLAKLTSWQQPAPGDSD